MDRELVLGVLVLLVCGPALHLFALVPAGSLEDGSGRRLEEVSWARLWLPVLPASIGLCLLVGWALQEPDHSDERLLPLVFVVVSPFAIVTVRAVERAVRALVTSDRPSAGTVGLVRPRVFLARTLLDALDPEAVAAARLHEEAHVRHRDPLRIWLAQLATDLQWPWPAAEQRLRRWLHALEIARDEEARARGADGADLAAAIVTAARLQRAGAASVSALTGTGEALKERITRLLEPVPADEPTRARRLRPLVVVAVILAALTFGLHHGEVVVRSLPGVDTSLPS